MKLSFDTPFSLCLVTGCFFVAALLTTHLARAEAPPLPNHYCTFAQQMLPTIRRIMERNEMMQRETQFDLADLPATNVRCDLAFPVRHVSATNLRAAGSAAEATRRLQAWEIPFVLGERSLALMTVAPSADDPQGLVMESFGRAPAASAFDVARKKVPPGQVPEVVTFPEARIRMVIVPGDDGAAPTLEPITAEDLAQWRRLRDQAKGDEGRESEEDVTVEDLAAVFNLLANGDPREPTPLRARPDPEPEPLKDLIDRELPQEDRSQARQASSPRANAQGASQPDDPQDESASAAVSGQPPAADSRGNLTDDSEELPKLSLIAWIFATLIFIGINVSLYWWTRWYLRRRWLDRV